jgi:hypothetical protein
MTEQQWLASDDPSTMLAVIRSWNARGADGGPDGHIAVSGRKLRLFACACCRQVWHLLTDERSRQSVEVAERFADGKVTDEQCETVWLAARTAGMECGFSPRATMLAQDCTWHNSEACAVGAVQQGEAEEGPHLPAQSVLLRDIVGNSFRRRAIPRACLTADVTSLAQAAYDERILPSGELDLARLAILSDALEDAGCADADLLSHLRSSGPHVRGCWVLDLLLGIE